jgi:predicted phosphohydrolase
MEKEMIIKVALYSDLHTEFGNKFPAVPINVEVVVLAGDDIVGEGHGELEEFCNENYDKQVVMIAGNHNYYDGEFHAVNKMYKEEIILWAPNLHFLNNDTFKYKDIVFHGCTLWTDFSCKGEVWKSIGMMEAQLGISDFHRIRYGDSNITPTVMSNLHLESLQWLSKSLKDHSGKTNVVVTHFPPLMQCKHPHIPEGILDTYFNNNLVDFVDGHDIDWWMYGHNHSSDEFEAYNTRFVSNQKGYPREKTKYDEFLVLDI